MAACRVRCQTWRWVEGVVRRLSIASEKVLNNDRVEVTYLPYIENFDKEVAGEMSCQHLRDNEHI